MIAFLKKLEDVVYRCGFLFLFFMLVIGQF